MSDCRSLVKTLVCGAKTITWGTASCKSPITESTMVVSKQFHPKVSHRELSLMSLLFLSLSPYRPSFLLFSIGRNFGHARGLYSIFSPNDKLMSEYGTCKTSHYSFTVYCMSSLYRNRLLVFYSLHCIVVYSNY